MHHSIKLKEKTTKLCACIQLVEETGVPDDTTKLRASTKLMERITKSPASIQLKETEVLEESIKLHASIQLVETGVPSETTKLPQVTKKISSHF